MNKRETQEARRKAKSGQEKQAKEGGGGIKQGGKAEGVALAQVSVDRTESYIVNNDGKKIAVTTKLLPSDDIGFSINDICGIRLEWSGSSDYNYRIFRSDGTGTWANECPPGQNSASITWGFVLSDSDKSKLQIKTFFDWGWSLNAVDTVGKAAKIVMRFSGDCDGDRVYDGIIGVNNGKVTQGPGYGYVENKNH